MVNVVMTYDSFAKAIEMADKVKQMTEREPSIYAKYIRHDKDYRVSVVFDVNED